MDAWPLVVRAGTPVRAAGTVVRAAGGFALWHTRGHLPSAPAIEHPAALPGLVPVHGAAHDWDRLLGDPVAVAGDWVGDGVDVDQVARTGGTPVIADEHDIAAADRGVRPFPPAHVVRAAEQPLWDSGSLLWRVILAEPDGVRVRVAAHEPEVVIRALRPVYGDSLEVVGSPWDRDAYDRIDEAWALAERQGLLFALARGMCDDGLGRVSLGLTRVSSELAEALAPVPVGPLNLDVMVLPQ